MIAMPYEIRKLPNQDKYRVRNKDTGQIKAKSTTKTNAQKLVRLLNGLEHGMKPRIRRKKP